MEHLLCVEAVLEIAVAHWPFSDQSQHLRNQTFKDFGAYSIPLARV